MTSSLAWPACLRRYERRCQTLKAQCPSLCLPFEARRLSGASVAWLNDRWFLQHGLNVSLATNRAIATTWILERFAWTVPHAHDLEDSFTPEAKVIDADRYGGIGIGFHGGSGRLGIVDGFHVKGLGPTPLVGNAVDLAHSTGLVTLESGISEAVYAELADAELPLGAIPVVAVIDTGTRTHWGEKRGLIVRPAFFRVSYLERAPNFRPLVRPYNDFVQDAARVEQVAQMVFGSPKTRHVVGISVRSFDEFLDRAAKQLAHTLANRLHFGPWVTSNLTADGEVFDYGAATALPDWGVVATRPIDKDDPEVFEECLNDLVFYLRKHSTGSTQLPEKADVAFAAAFDGHFARELALLFGLHESNCSKQTLTRVCLLLKRFYKMQTRVSKHSAAEKQQFIDMAWLYAALEVSNEGHKEAPCDSADLPSNEPRSLIRAIHDLLRAEYGDAPNGQAQIRASFAAAKRLLLPRSALFRDQILQKRIYAEIVECEHASNAAMVEKTREFIRQTVSISRRVFREIPQGWNVLGAVSDIYSSAVWCQRFDNHEQALFLTGSRSDNAVCLFGQSTVLRQDKNRETTSTHALQVAVPIGYIGEGLSVEADSGAVVNVPALEILFDRPA